MLYGMVSVIFGGFGGPLKVRVAWSFNHFATLILVVGLCWRPPSLQKSELVIKYKVNKITNRHNLKK